MDGDREATSARSLLERQVQAQADEHQTGNHEESIGEPRGGHGRHRSSSVVDRCVARVTGRFQRGKIRRTLDPRVNTAHDSPKDVMPFLVCRSTFGAPARRGMCRGGRSGTCRATPRAGRRDVFHGRRPTFEFSARGNCPQFALGAQPIGHRIRGRALPFQR